MSIELSSIETINRLLSDVLGTFPSVYNSNIDPSDRVFLEVVNPLLERSVDLCNSFNKGVLGIKKKSGGGQSVAGPFLIKLQKPKSNPEELNIKISSISFGSQGGWKSYFMAVIAKTAIERREKWVKCGTGSDRKKGCISLLKMKVEKEDGVITYISSDMLHESIVGALTSHLFDIGVAPSLMKYLGTYACPELESYISTQSYEKGVQPLIIMEKSDIELFELLNTKLFEQLTPMDFIIWFVQLAHTMYVMKYHFGITHYDLHLRNVMLTYTKKVLEYKSSVTKLCYDKKDLDKIDHYVYQMPFNDESGHPAYIVVENNGFLPKMIDFGHTTASFTHEGIPLEFKNMPEEYDQLNFPPSVLKQYGWDESWNVNHALEKKKNGDLEYNFFTMNLLYKFLTKKGDPLVDKYLAENSSLMRFIKHTVPISNKEWKESFKGLEHHGKDPKVWLMRRRAVGTTTDIASPLKRIWNFLAANIESSVINGKTFLVLNREGKVPVNFDNSVFVPIKSDPSLSNVNKFLNANKILWKECILHPPKSQKEVSNLLLRFGLPKNANICGSRGFLKKTVDKYDPNSKLFLDFFEKVVDGKPNKFWNGSSLSDHILPNDLKDFKRLDLGKGQIKLFTLKFLPEFTNMLFLGGSATTKFKKTQRATDYKSPENVGDLLKTLNMHLIYIKDFPVAKNVNLHQIKISVEKEDLFTTSEDKLKNVNYGVSINGGYFVVGGNIHNELTPGLEQNNLQPIGYFFSTLAPQYNGTVLPIPLPYKSSFATIYVDVEGRLQMERSTLFMDRHHTESKIFLVAPEGTEDNIAVQQKVIKMKYSEKLKMMVPDVIDRSFKYVSAFESGPILIWDNKIIFNEEKMNMEEFTFDNYDNHPSYTRYKLFKGAKNYKMWFNEEGEGQFMYGARHSNSLMIHNVLCKTNTGETLIILVEGRGFDAVGIDRVQLAELIKNFNVSHAVALDGGFSANAVFRFDKKSYWLMNDPDKRKIATSIHFGAGHV
jgi:Phosphodiester glycosidase